MKWRQETDFRQSPFKLLTLPDSGRTSVDNGLTSVTPTMSMGFHRMATRNKTPSSATWPRPKMKRSKCKVSVTQDSDDVDDDGRPKTATLERPKVLDISFLGKIDMTSLTKKSLMSIANLCILPVKQDMRKNGGYLSVGRIYKSKKTTPQHSTSSSPSPSLRKGRRSVLAKETASDTESICKTRELPPNNSNSKTPIKSSNLKVRSQVNVLNREKSQDTNNNEKDSKKSVSRPKTVIPKKSKHVDEVFGGPVVVPEPCTTCGRPELPERLHSHPVAPRTLPRTPLLPPTPLSPRPAVVKSSVRKPVAIKYRSEKTRTEGVAPPEKKVPATVVPPKMKGPRTVMCYVCGRGFGTASYPLHEPQCLQKWQRENAVLPAHLQRPPPRRPDLPANSEEWNRLAFQASQSQLVACENCGRTFNPDRLEVHLRSCRPEVKRIGTLPRTPDGSSGADPESVPANTRFSGPPIVHCYICGRMFGTKSISIHEPQCLEKWRTENEQLAAHQKRPEPVKPETRLAPGAHVAVAPSPPPPPPAATAAPKKPPTGLGGRKGRTVPCYLCGREFFAGSINIHEPQCLVKWHIENDKLPPDKRRKEPEKPDVKYTAAGTIDFEGTMDAIWESHLQQLIPCKHCGRTFNPDRVDVHERSCKGPRH